MVDETRSRDKGRRMRQRRPSERTRTLEGLWWSYGAAIRHRVGSVLDSNGSLLDAACCEVMVRAAVELGAVPVEDTADDLAEFFDTLSEQVCEDLRAGRMELSVPARPMPEAIPAALRAHFQGRVLRRWAQEELLADDPQALAHPNPLERMRAAIRAQFEHGRAVLATGALSLQRIARSLRDGARRVGASIGPAVADAGSPFGAIVAELPALSQVAAVIAVAGIGLGVAPSSVPTAPSQRAVLTAAARTTPVVGAVVEAPDALTDARLRTNSGVPDPNATAIVELPTPPLPPSPSPSQQPEEPPEPHPEVGANVSEIAREPVQRQSEDGWTTTETATLHVSADVDGDGEDEIDSERTPVFVDCPPPDERGAVTGIACPALEEVPT